MQLYEKFAQNVVNIYVHHFNYCWWQIHSLPTCSVSASVAA